MKESLSRDALATINKYQMLEPGDKVLVGFSGGPDSMALLYFLNTIRHTLGIKLWALHINHQLRPNASIKEQKFCIEVCKKMGVPIRTSKINVKEYARQHKLSIEEGARVLRYEQLFKLAKTLKCSKVALGHNANDNTETVIMNLIRGTGLSGLSGIPPCRDKIIRPLIKTERVKILSYLKEHKLKYCHDMSNIELGYRRNYLRHKIIPLLQDINPNLNYTISRTSEIIRNVNYDIIRMADDARKKTLVKTKNGGILLDIKKLSSYNLSIRREIIKSILPKTEFEPVENILQLINRQSGKIIELTKELSAWREYDKLYIGPVKKPDKIDAEWQVNIGKATIIPELGITLNTKIIRRAKKISDPGCQLFDKSGINLPLKVRLRKTGDRFVPFHGKEKKLKDLLIDDKIPQRSKDRLPLLCDRNNILWIVGSRRANLGLINESTKEIIEVKVLKWQNNQ